MDQVTGLRYGLNVGQWMTDYPMYLLAGSLSGFGFVARRRAAAGRGAGQRFTALTLDELAALCDAAEERRALIRGLNHQEET